MDYAAIHLAYDGPLAILTLNRPDRLNALDWNLARELLHATQDVMADDSVRALLLTGAGRGFCAGADLKDVQAANEAGSRFDAAALLREAINPTLTAMVEGAKPVVCAVNGAAAGAGCGLALAADIVLAARSASFLQAFVRIGVVPDAGSSWLLPRLVGRSRAMAMMMLGEKIPAETAADWGLVHAVFDDDALMSAAHALALKLAAGPTRAYAAIKRMAETSVTHDLPRQLDVEASEQAAAFDTKDFAEGVAAFTEGRQPTFTGD
jgi:2-(1,2-epoxy-1,2-dihydrophenyl)acetyl-CoA isomerase